jgi:chemotaxis response regulator CheB
MGLVLWIDHNTFATSLIERAFKKKSLPFYTLTSVDDFAYLVEDLNPALIVLDGETYDMNAAAFLKQYEGSEKMQKLPFVLLEPKSDFGFIKKKLGELKKPLEPFKLPDQLTAMISGAYN